MLKLTFAIPGREVENARNAKELDAKTGYPQGRGRWMGEVQGSRGWRM